MISTAYSMIGQPSHVKYTYEYCLVFLYLRIEKHLCTYVPPLGLALAGLDYEVPATDCDADWSYNRYICNLNHNWYISLHAIQRISLLRTQRVMPDMCSRRKPHHRYDALAAPSVVRWRSFSSCHITKVIHTKSHHMSTPCSVIDFNEHHLFPTLLAMLLRYSLALQITVFGACPELNVDSLEGDDEC